VIREAKYYQGIERERAEESEQRARDIRRRNDFQKGIRDLEALFLKGTQDLQQFLNDETEAAWGAQDEEASKLLEQRRVTVDLRTECDRLEERVRELEKDNNQLEEDKKQLQADIDYLSRDLSEARQNQSTSPQVGNQSTKEKELQKELDDLRVIYERSKRQHERARNDVIGLENVLEGDSGDDDTRMELKTKNERIENFKTSIPTMEGEIQKKEKELAQRRDERLARNCPVCIRRMSSESTKSQYSVDSGYGGSSEDNGLTTTTSLALVLESNLEDTTGVCLQENG
jgi:chromosome segregation ATPase